MNSHQRIFFLLNRAQHQLIKRADQELTKKFGISSVQMGALFFLLQNEGCVLKQLSLGLQLNNSAVTGLVNRMEIGGLVEKRPCDRDGRAYRVHLTRKGKDIAQKGDPLVKTFSHSIAQGFSLEEMEVIMRFLNNIIDGE